MKVALVHDYLNQRGGAERVFAHIARAFPEAPVYTALFDSKTCGTLVEPNRVHTSFLQRIPFRKRLFRAMAPLYPRAFEAFDFSEFDLVVSSTTSWAKGIIVPAHTKHVCYINTVSRFRFDYDAYVGGFGLGRFARPLARRLARWDELAAQRPSAYIANSHNVAARVRRFYHRDAAVLPCPVDLARFSLSKEQDDYFIVIARLLPYKRVDLAIAACAVAGVRLVVVGDGPARRALERAARGTRTEFTGSVSDAELNSLLGKSRAAIVAAEEDFGLVPLEAAAAGRPAIAYRGGGARETVVEGETGEFFEEQTALSLAAALQRFDAARYDPAALRAHAERFAPEKFIARLRELVVAL